MRRASSAPGRARRRWHRSAVVLLPVLLLLTSCSGDAGRFGYKKPITEQGHRALSIWTGFFWLALVVGVLVYALILWACFRYRKRGDKLPAQVHYNLPVEVLYTILPFVLVAALFYYTARDETYLDKLSANPDLRVGVVGFQWSWQFNYVDENLQVTGRPGQFPTLVLPVGKRVQFIETSPDVIHSFWVPEFLFKRDVIPGRSNKFEITTEDTGTFDGRCTELCGVYHSKMLFTVKVVSDADYQQFLTTAKQEAASGNSDMYSTTSVAAGSTS